MSDITNAVSAMINKAYSELGDIDMTVCVTGSGGLSVGKWLSLPFVQEVIAASNAVKQYIPETDVAIELGGEDRKDNLFFRQHRTAHERNVCRRHRRIYRPDGIASADGCQGP